MAGGGRKGERTLEGRHVVGLFLLMLVFSGVFFTLGFVMGRSPYDSDVRASASVPPSVKDRPRLAPDSAAKKACTETKSRLAGTSPNAPQSDWDFYHSGEPKKSVDQLTPAGKTVAVANKSASADSAPANSARSKSPLNAPAIPGGAMVLQVAALTRQADALALAESLQRKGFPAFVLTPGADHFYRVQVGPYADAQTSDAAKKGLEKVGFKAIVKR